MRYRIVPQQLRHVFNVDHNNTNTMVLTPKLPAQPFI